jgi:hypothetical protein
MGNCSYLRVLAEPVTSVSDATVLRTGKNSIPALWFTLFESSDQTVFELPLNSALTVEVPGLLVPMAKARERLARALPFLHSCLPQGLHAVLAQWEAMAAAVSLPFVALDPADLSLVLEPHVLQAWLTEGASAFIDRSPEHLIAAFDVTGLEFDPVTNTVTAYDAALAPFALSGF